MIAKANVNLGTTSYQFEIEEKDEIETLHKIIILSNPPIDCNSCNTSGSDNFKFTSNKDKEANVYINVKCTHCGARSKLGQYKAGGYFWHDFEKYVPKKEGGDNQNEQAR